ncbi:MAG: hypothetical protein FRX49_02364 [Trebouxia sp. A1-2]|nr:MAG: hypothetical protein FRX49_02364 [Trebouxia sp. A1-2]
MSPVCAPAMSASSTYSQSQELEAALQQMIQSRLETGQGPLPELRAQKSVRKVGPEVQSALAMQQVEQTQDMAVLQAQLDGLKSTLNQQKAAAQKMVQNGLGVLFAICWFAFLYLQNKQKVQTEEQLAAERNPEQSAVETAQQVLDEEQGKEKVESTQASR